MQKLILVNYQSPGDLVMLTAAVRDLHQCHPNQFITDVRTSSPELWENNPYLTALDIKDTEVKTLHCHYPLIQFSNQRPVHFLSGFIEYLNDQLGCQIKPTRFAGDIHLSELEKTIPSPVEQMTGSDVPFWVIVAGGKFDYTVKWWHFRRWQAVVDHFQGRILFVQVGERHHYHPALDGVLDLRGKTTLRQLIRLIYHAQGVLCPVTLHMHLAAAVEGRRGGPPNRPCVVVAGGREPPSWEAYPGHRFLHTVGALPCCATGGCWRSRSVPLGDGDEKDDARHLCLDTVENLPRCMHLITPDGVAEEIELCLQSATLNGLKAGHARKVAPFLSQRMGLALPHERARMFLSRESTRVTKKYQTKNNQPHDTYARERLHSSHRRRRKICGREQEKHSTI